MSTCEHKGPGPCHICEHVEQVSIPSSPILNFMEASRAARKQCGVGDFQIPTAKCEEVTRQNLESQAQAAVSPLLAEIKFLKGDYASRMDALANALSCADAAQREIERLKGELKVVCRVGEVNTATASETIERLEAEAQKLREALGWTMEFVPNPKTEPINPNYREDFERQYAEARKALGGS